VIYFLIRVSVSWQLSLTAVIGTVVIASILHVFTKYSRKLGALRSVVTAKFYSELAEFLAGIKFIKTSALEEKSFGQVVTSSQRVGQVDSKMGIAQGALQSMSELLFVFFLIMGLLVGTKIFVVPTSEVALFTLLFFRIFQQSKKNAGRCTRV
jgi:ABC-type multidrug transport system fused ATPase/permease subunit